MPQKDKYLEKNDKIYSEGIKCNMHIILIYAIYKYIIHITDIPGRFHSLLKEQIDSFLDNEVPVPLSSFCVANLNWPLLCKHVTPTLELRNASRPGVRCAFNMLTALIVF